MEFCVGSMSCCALLCVVSSFAIFLMVMRELVAVGWSAVCDFAFPKSLLTCFDFLFHLLKRVFDLKRNIKQYL